MISRSIQEWSYLQVAESADDGESVTRAQADRLLAVGERAAGALKLGGGEFILADGRRQLRAGQIVGLLAIRDLTLEILPKIDGADGGRTRENLVHMLARTLDLPIAEGSLAKLGWQHHSLLEIFIRLFCDRLFAAVHRGRPRRYVSREDDLPALRGRLDAVRQFTRLAVMPQTLACRYGELSPDIAINQIMKAAVMRLRRFARAPSNQRRLIELEFALADVTAVPPMLLPWEKVILDRTNRSWVDLLKLAKLLLNNRFQTTSAGASAGFSLLFEMNTLFEEFIGRTLQGVVRCRDQRVTLQRPKSHAVIDGEGKGRFATVPDIVLHGAGNTMDWIIDTKWKQLKGAIDDPKQGVSQGDVYQMMAYAQVYECQRLMLLYPHHHGLGQSAGRIAEFVVSGTEDTRLVIATVDLGRIASVPDQLNNILAVASQRVTEARDGELRLVGNQLSSAMA